jgi:hypothetical protein
LCSGALSNGNAKWNFATAERVKRPDFIGENLIPSKMTEKKSLLQFAQQRKISPASSKVMSYQIIATIAGA